MSYGFEALHYLVESAFVEGASGREVSDVFLRELAHQQPFDAAPIYALLHEPAYAQERATRWAAERVRSEFPEFEPSGDRPVYFTGEMVYQWMFDEFRGLQPLRRVAELLAEYEEWPSLYDGGRLRANEVPVVAAVYENDMYVERSFSLETAETIHADVWVTSEYEHDGLRSWGEEVLGRLIAMRRGEVYTL
jgi:hypothetical protein